MIARVIPVRPFDLIIFGATGDLARRKIFPALYSRFRVGQMPMDSTIVAIGRKNLSRSSFKNIVKECLETSSQAEKSQSRITNTFLSRLRYVALGPELDENWSLVKSFLRNGVPRIFYLSVGPELFEKIASRIFESGLISDESRIVVEKPLGTNLETAKSLNKILKAYFRENQIYRIDHYLGKETVQNLMALRFSNILFEPLWNSNFVDHVQITVAEEIGVGGRGAYYDKTGALKDMVQNHIMQLLCLTAMEPPSQFSSDSVRDEKSKVIHALSPVDPKHIVRGQYWKNIKENYKLDVESGKSTTESYVALKVFLNNWRWANTPFYLRTGKKLANRRSEIAIFFKKIPHSIFNKRNSETPNALFIRLQPNEGITLKANIKEPGPGGMRLVSVPLDMTFADALGEGGLKQLPDAYERLIMDIVRGDQTLFMRGDEVELAWAWIDLIAKGTDFYDNSPQKYSPGSAGPLSAQRLLEVDGRKWTEI